jgi:hypothetical protein
VEVEGHARVVLLDDLPRGLLHRLGADATHGGGCCSLLFSGGGDGWALVVQEAAARGLESRVWGRWETGTSYKGLASRGGLGFRAGGWISAVRVTIGARD